MASLSTAEKIRLLQCATFGATPAMVQDFGSLDRAAWLDREMDRPRSTRHLAWVNQMWTAWLARPARKYPTPYLGADPAKEFNMVQLWRAYLEAPDQLRKRVGAALLEIFVVNARVSAIGIKNNTSVTASYIDALEGAAFTTYRQLLGIVSRHAAMGHFLSHINNQKAEYDASGVPIRIPDENYAREVMQLFSIGLYQLNLDGSLKMDAKGRPLETYTQSDVFNLARVFTGFTGAKDTIGAMGINAAWHSPEQKKFLGLVIPANTGPLPSLNAALDHLANHPNVGPFLGKQLIQRLVTANPSPQYVRDVATVFNNNGAGVRGDLRATIKAILTHPEATAVTPPSALVGIRGKVREPMIRLTAVMRYLGVSSDRLFYPIGNLSDSSTGIGQSPLKSPSVFNFFRPGYSPTGSELNKRGLVSPELQITTGTQVMGSINTINDAIWNVDTYLNKRSQNARFQALAASASDLVDDAALYLTGGPLNSTYRKQLIGHVNAIPATDWWARTRVATIGVSSSREFLVQT